MSVINLAAPQRFPAPADSASGGASPLNVALVNMPFASAWRPSIQCGLLKAILTRAGHNVDVHYLNLNLAKRLGPHFYGKLSDSRHNDLILGEWLFSRSAFGTDIDFDGDSYATSVRGLDRACDELGLDFEALERLRDEALPAIVDEWARDVNWASYRVVGFTSTFEQNNASFALARRIKNDAPETLCIFGGANFDGEMGPEFVRCLPFIDYAIVGEADESIVGLMAAISNNTSAFGVPGVIGRENGSTHLQGRATNIERMDSLPDPDYDDYFSALFSAGIEVADDSGPLLPVETARGCWWGQKHHCTFCGLNGASMAFRSKSPDRVLSEFRRQSDRYKILNFEAVDNIMEMHYLTSVLEPLASERWDYSIFYEVKANLTREQLRIMRAGGITSIQPGIESLSTEVLKLMRKGTTLLQNLRVLKWALYYDINVSWNLIMGFPGERLAYYERQLELLPYIYHLQPPSGAGPIWLERFSPYFFDKSLPVENIRPKPAYRYVYPPEIDSQRVAYFFDCDFGDRLPESVFRQVVSEIETWRTTWAESRPRFVYQRSPDWIQIVDLRTPGQPSTYALSSVEAHIYELCGDRERTPESVSREIRASTRFDTSAEEVAEILNTLCKRGAVVEDGGRYLSLALPVSRR